MQDKIKTIYLRDLSWVDVEGFARSIGFKDVSPFVEYCVSKTIHKKKLSGLYYIGTLLVYALIVVLLVLINMRL